MSWQRSIVAHVLAAAILVAVPAASWHRCCAAVSPASQRVEPSELPLRPCCRAHRSAATRRAEAPRRVCCCGLSTTRCVCHERKAPPSLPAPAPAPQDQRPTTDITVAAAVPPHFDRSESRPACGTGSTACDLGGLSAHQRCALLAVWLK